MAILLQSDVFLPRYGQKRFFTFFQTSFIAFTSLFWALWWLFCLSMTYSCKETGKNVLSQVLKKVLRHSQHLISAHWWLIYDDRMYRCIDMSNKVSSRTLKPVIQHLLHFLSTLVVINFLHQWDVPFPSYGRNLIFAGFEKGFRTFSALFWALLCPFCVNWTYFCQDTGRNVSSRSLKSVLQYSSLFFEHFGGYFASLGRTVAKKWAEMYYHKFWNQFYGIRHTWFPHIGG